MGFFTDIKAIGNIQKIKRGGTAKLSIAQIVNAIINLPDAKKNFSDEVYNQIKSLFNKMRCSTTQIPMNMDLYIDTAVKIIIEFDKIAPYEKYCGGGEFEYSLLMQDIWGKNCDQIRQIKREIYNAERYLAEDAEDYKKYCEILNAACTEAELNEMLVTGQKTLQEIEEYKAKMEVLRQFVTDYSTLRNSTLSYIDRLQRELRELEE